MTNRFRRLSIILIMALLVSSIPVRADDIVVDPQDTPAPTEEQEIPEEQEIEVVVEEPEETEEPVEPSPSEEEKKDSEKEKNDKKEETEVIEEEAWTDEATDEEEAGDPADDDEWLFEHNISKNDDGTYEEIDEEGNRRVYDPEDPDFYKFYKNSKKELIPLRKDFSESDGFMSEEGRPDPFTCILTGYKYSYPSYYKTSDESKRVRVRYGMDISKYQGNISVENWKILKETYGIDFAFIRAGYRGYGAAGNIRPDECFETNIVNARKAGVEVGVYFFSQATSTAEAVEEAVKCISYIGDKKDLVTLPVVIDYEYMGEPGRLKAANLSRKEHTDIVNAFCKRVANAGFLPGIYANRSMLTDDMILSDIAQENYIWMANWPSSKATVKSTSYTGRLCSWQYTDSFSGFGDKGKKLMKSDALDLDFWFGDFPGEDNTEDEEEPEEPVIPTEEPEEDEPDIPDPEPEVDPDTFVISGVEDRTYTGKPVTFDTLEVKQGKNLLTEGVDYSVKYSANTRVGTGRVTITGKGNYSGTYPVTFKINPLDMTGRIKAGDITLTYNGRAQKGTTNVLFRQDDGTWKTLKSGTDFKYVYTSDYVGDPDTDTDYTVQIVGKGNYTGTASFTETILKKATDRIPIGKLNITRIKTQQLTIAADGSIIPATPIPLVRYKGEELDERSLDIEYVNNASAGTASIYLTGKGAFSGTRKIDFKIASLALSKASITGIENKVYTSFPVMQNGYEVRYGENDTLLVEGRDYTVSYSNNIKTGRNAAITFTGIGAYSGSVRKLFSIEQAALSDGTSKNPDIRVFMKSTVPYTKGGAEPEVQMLYTTEGGQYTLIRDEDYTLEYFNNKSVNDATSAKTRPGVYIIGKGNFTGKLVAGFAIDRGNIGATTVYVSDVIIPDQGDDAEPEIRVCDTDGEELEPETDYTYSIETNIVTINGIGNYYGSRSAQFRYADKSIESAAVKIAEKTYTGSAITLTKDDFTLIKVGKTILEKDDFEIIPGSYENNVTTGKAKVRIRGLRDYGGIKTVTFKIVKRKIKK